MKKIDPKPVVAEASSGVLDPQNALNSAEVKPTVLKVTGASSDVDNGGETFDNLLTITGTAGYGVTLDVFDGIYPVEVVVAQSDGTWRLTLSGLTETEHRITAKTVGGVLVSEAWMFTVVSKPAGYEDWEVPPSLLSLNVPVERSNGLIVTLTRIATALPPVFLEGAGSVEGRYSLGMNPGNTVRFDFDATVNRVTFSYNQGSPRVKMIFRGAGDLVISTYTFNSGSAQRADIILSQPCAWCELISDERYVVFFDEFRWFR